jgi:2-methylisocitrate lyase-like PEP mutase family enzyme
MGRLLPGDGAPPGARDATAPEARTTLRELLRTGDPVLAPGCYDALSARLIEEAGFPAAYMSGFASTAARIGRPDIGLLTLTEMVDNARSIAQALEIPLIADADTGFGNPLNVIRTVREYEAAGVAAIHIEDQLMPKRCGHMEGKRLIAPGAMTAKIAAAVAARGAGGMLIIARTDARAVEGLPAALERAKAYADAGADVLFVEAPQSHDEIETIARTFPDVPLLFNYAEGGKTPAVTHARLWELGFAIVIFPLSVVLAATGAIREVLKTIRADGTPIAALPSLPGFDAFLDFIGMPEVRELERRFPEP